MKKTEFETNSIHIKKNTIRRYFYIGTISAIFLLTIILSSLYIQSLNEEYSHKIKQLSKSIIHEKKRFLRNAVERTIYLIEIERKHAIFKNYTKRLSTEQLKKIKITRIKKIIRNLRLIDDGYIWVNSIVNFNGGEKYAIRLIHPNLPHTEGQWLSTNTTDIKGNYPYKTELEGIKKNGELYYDYYFKKMNSQKIIHKMSYAKLYKPYNWVIATGVYLDDVDKFIQNETKEMQRTFKKQLINTSLIALFAVLLSIILVIYFERQIRKMIIAYEDRIDIYTKELENLSETDPLTGLYNRLKLDNVFIKTIEHSQRYENNFSILMMDLDKFKNINDSHGHLVGDQILKKIAAILRENARVTDTVGRWGGEEFLIIFPETVMKDAINIAEKIRAIIENYAFDVIGSMTCSFGVTTYHAKDTIESMIYRADLALYKAKEKGRNKVCSEII